jgi:Protein of unknown function (DUF4199)
MLNKPYVAFPVIYGILAGIATFLLLLIMQFGFDINPLGGKKEVGVIFVIFAMIFVVAGFRKSNGGVIEFKQAFGLCFITTLIASVVSMIFLYVYLQTISPTILPEYISKTAQELTLNKTQIIKNGIAETDFNDALTNIKKTSVKSILQDDFIKKLFLSIVPSFMIALYFKRKFIN